MSGQGHEWDYFPLPDGEPFKDKDGHWVLGWHDPGKDVETLTAAFEAYHGGPVILREILVRTASDVECRINGWDEGSFVRCTPRAKHSWTLLQVEENPVGEGEGQ